MSFFQISPETLVIDLEEKIQSLIQQREDTRQFNLSTPQNERPTNARSLKSFTFEIESLLSQKNLLETEAQVREEKEGSVEAPNNILEFFKNPLVLIGAGIVAITLFSKK